MTSSPTNIPTFILGPRVCSDRKFAQGRWMAVFQWRAESSFRPLDLVFTCCSPVPREISMIYTALAGHVTVNRDRRNFQIASLTVPAFTLRFPLACIHFIGEVEGGTWFDNLKISGGRIGPERWQIGASCNGRKVYSIYVMPLRAILSSTFLSDSCGVEIIR